MTSKSNPYTYMHISIMIMSHWTSYLIDHIYLLDIDECKVGHNCSQLQVCTNTPGSYNCSCSEGYQMEADECIGETACAMLLIKPCEP